MVYRSLSSVLATRKGISGLKPTQATGLLGLIIPWHLDNKIQMNNYISLMAYRSFGSVQEMDLRA
jgi:hypothetical protein